MAEQTERLQKLRYDCVIQSIHVLGGDKSFAAIMLASLLYDWTVDGKIPTELEMNALKKVLSEPQHNVTSQITS